MKTIKIILIVAAIALFLVIFVQCNNDTVDPIPQSNYNTSGGASSDVFIREMYYSGCGHSIYSITNGENLYVQKDSICPNHYLLKLIDDDIIVTNIQSGEIVESSQNIGAFGLPQEERDKLKDGIEVYSEYEKDRLIEVYTS